MMRRPQEELEEQRKAAEALCTKMREQVEKYQKSRRKAIATQTDMVKKYTELMQGMFAAECLDAQCYGHMDVVSLEEVAIDGTDEVQHSGTTSKFDERVAELVAEGKSHKEAVKMAKEEQ